jgi:hypothetical protein
LAVRRWRLFLALLSDSPSILPSSSFIFASGEELPSLIVPFFGTAVSMPPSTLTVTLKGGFKSIQKMNNSQMAHQKREELFVPKALVVGGGVR